MALKDKQYKLLIAMLLSDGYGVKFTAKGGSMFPAICHKDTLIIEPVLPHHIRTGDILCINSSLEGLLVHRVITVFCQNDMLMIRTKGDASSAFDLPVPASEALGRVSLIEQVSTFMETR